MGEIWGRYGGDMGDTLAMWLKPMPGEERWGRCGGDMGDTLAMWLKPMPGEHPRPHPSLESVERPPPSPARCDSGAPMSHDRTCPSPSKSFIGE